MQDLFDKVEELKNSLTGDMFTDMEIKEQIHKLEMEIKGVKSVNDECPIDGSCDSCGA
jgi:hypothetical protein|tara:strand:+ start:342 stop:515 length:174 start_codon:yes stop_codon:yes gene_type:complete